MALNRTEAIILKSQRQGETTKILTLYTKAFGKLSLIAKGARTSRGRYWGSLELFNHVSVLFYHKENRDLQFLSQADILHSFLRIRSELGRMTLAMLACEWIQKSEMGGAANTGTFNLLLETLKALDCARGGLKNIVRCFQLHSMELHGLKPDLHGCVSCHREAPSESISFDVENGSYRCHDCMPVAGLTVSGGALDLLRWLEQVMPSAAGGKKVKSETGREVDELLLQFAGVHMEGLKALRVPEVLSEITGHLKRGKGSAD